MLTRDRKVKYLEVILKISERCNINCSYCYYFNGGNNDYENMPAKIDEFTIEKLSSFINNAIERNRIEHIFIDLHGGEPLLLGKKKFKNLCQSLTERVSKSHKINFGIQTNATLIDQEWIDIFSYYNISVGVSLDGPKIYNDQYRIDKKGRSTYEKTYRGIELLNQAHINEKIMKPGVICVLNKDFDVEKIYNHFTKVLSFTTINFLLPDEFYGSKGSNIPHNYGRALCSIFDLWVKDFKTVSIRFISSFIKKISGENPSTDPKYSTTNSAAVVMTVQSNGDIGPEDTLRVLPIWPKNNKLNVFDNDLTDIINSGVNQTLITASNQIPSECKDCCWSKICRGGELVNRFSTEKNNFNNASFYCAALKEFYSHATQFLIDNGMPIERIKNNLFSEEDIQTINNEEISPEIETATEPA